MSQQPQQISAQQYELILKYMETTNEQNYDEAVNMMKAYDFNLQQAVQTKLGLNDEALNGQTRGHERRERNQVEDDQQTRIRNTLRVQQDVRKYIQFVRQKNNRSIIAGIFNFTKNLVSSVFCGLTQLILPEFILKKIMRSRFFNLYHDRILPELRDRSLTYHLKSSPESRKAILFVISSPTAHQSIIGLFNNPQIVKKIDESFILTGSLLEEKQCNQIQGEKQTPMIVVCRMSIFEKIQIIKRYIGDQQISEITTEKLNHVIREHQRLARRDRNLLVRYRNYLRRTYYGNRPLYLEQEQEEELYHVERMSTHTNLIHQQNNQYKKVEEQTRRKQSLQLLEKQKQEEQKRKFSQLEQQRKVRKMSIPDEPHSGDIIRINFRCPDGSTKIRNFESNQKLELIYAWVETNEQIEFEDEKKRQFELMHGFPPCSLSDRKEKMLKDVFDSDQEKIMIREI